MTQDRSLITISYDEAQAQQIKKMLLELPVRKRNPAYLRAMQFATAEVEAKLKENVSGPLLKKRTGHLGRTIGSRLITDDRGISAIIGSGARTGKRAVYADILETGGTIKPKNVMYLTIPLAAAKTASGVTRRRARQFPNTFIRNGVIFQRRGDEAVPLFVLKKSVKIPPFRYMAKTATEMQNVVFGAVEKAIEEIEAQ